MLKSISTTHPPDRTLTKALSSMHSSCASTETTDRSEPRPLRDGLIETIQEQSSECRLWRNVLGQNVRDLYDIDQGVRSRAIVWIVSPDFEVVCDMADVHPSDMREQMYALSTLSLGLARKFGRQLRTKLVGDRPD